MNSVEMMSSLVVLCERDNRNKEKGLGERRGMPSQGMHLTQARPQVCHIGRSQINLTLKASLDASLEEGSAVAFEKQCLGINLLRPCLHIDQGESIFCRTSKNLF